MTDDQDPATIGWMHGHPDPSTHVRRAAPGGLRSAIGVMGCRASDIAPDLRTAETGLGAIADRTRSVAWSRWLAPEPARTIARERAVSIALRTGHILAFGSLLGGSLWGIDPVRLRPALAATVASGGAMVLLELYKSLHWLFLGKGLFILAKLCLLIWLPYVGRASPILLAAIVVLGSVGAHLPSRFRHYSVLLRRTIKGAPLPHPQVAGGKPQVRA
ncbi:MAG: hypothetical protein R2909_03245 [Gemmatimonadales bacterium]